jgi:hypothetical protein
MSHHHPEPNARRQRKLAEEYARLLRNSQMRSVLVRPDPIETVTAQSSNDGVSQVTELAVDLPQGQRLTVKGLEPGTIVEVAAWSGKGGPDEGAVRMLFGASGDDSYDKASDPEGPSPEGVTGTMGVVPSAHLRHDTGVEALLNATDDASQPASLQQFYPTRRRAQPSKGKVIMRRLLVTAGVIAAIALTVGVLRWTNVLAFEHPTSGLTTGLGGAESSLAAVSPGANVEPSSTVLARIDGENVLVAVVQVGGDQYLVSTGTSQAVVNRDDVVGRVLFVVPFLGYVAGALP